jgi:DNA polymerase III delta subunit
MSFQHFMQEVEKGLKAPLYFLYAQDPYLLKEALLMAEGTVPEGERDFSVDLFDLDGIDESPPFEQVIDAVNTIPLAGSRKIVIIENIQELPKKDMQHLDRYAANPSPYSVLVLLHRGTPKALFKELMKQARATPLDVRPQELPMWIKEKALRKGVEITNEAVEYLLGTVGPDVGLLSSELEKAALMGKRRIDAVDVMGVAGGRNEYDVFALVNALKDRDSQMVFKVAKTLQETQEPYGLLGAINWHYSRMSSRDKGRTAYYDKVFALLNEADVRIKTSGGMFPLEYLLIRLLRV